MPQVSPFFQNSLAFKKFGRTANNLLSIIGLVESSSTGNQRLLIKYWIRENVESCTRIEHSTIWENVV